MELCGPVLGMSYVTLPKCSAMIVTPNLKYNLKCTRVYFGGFTHPEVNTAPELAVSNPGA